MSISMCGKQKKQYLYEINSFEIYCHMLLYNKFYFSGPTIIPLRMAKRMDDAHPYVPSRTNRTY